MTQAFETDVAIIGAGPVGLFAVFECGMLGLKCHVIDALEAIGGQCTALYPEKPIFDIPGYPQIEAGQLIAQLEAQAAPFAPVYHMGEEVVAVSYESSKWQLFTAAGNEIIAGAVIVAGGGGAFGPNRPPLDGLEAYEGTSVFYMVKRKADLAGKSIVIAGGGDSAVDWALSLSEIARKLYVVHRRDKFRAAPESVKKLHALADAGKIDLVVPAQLAGLEGDNSLLQGVRVQMDGGAERTLEAEILLPFFGLATDPGPVSGWGLALEGHHIKVDPTTAETSLPGIYAIGDIAAYSNKLKLILTGFAEGAQAAHAIYKRLHPGQDLHFEYSTTKGIPGRG